MRTREEINNVLQKVQEACTKAGEPTIQLAGTQTLALEVLLDIRDLLVHANRVEITGVPEPKHHD